MNKCLKKINSMGYMVFLKDGPHHQLMKVEKKFKKNKQKKEKKPKHESFAIFGEWVSGGEESSASSSDESNKKFTTRMGSSSNTCFIAKGMDSDVSDDDSDSPSIDELLDLVHEHQKVIKKQSKEIKNLNTLKDLNASLATNFEDLELIRKILHSLRRSAYDLVTTILYEKELDTMTPNQVLNKVIAHELRNNIKTKAPSSPPTHSCNTLI